MASTLPNGLPTQAADATRETLGGAVAVAGQLPGGLGDTLITAARSAFVNGMHTAAVAAAVVMAVASIVTVAVLRRATPRDSHPEAATLVQKVDSIAR